jgi:integrase
MASRPTPRIVVRHSRSCPSREGAACGRGCRPSFEAFVWSRRDKRKIRKTFATVGEAKAWRSDATGAVRRGTLKAASPVTVREAAEAWMAGAETGVVRNRSGDPYKPSALRGYRKALDSCLLPEFGAHKLLDIRRPDVQDLADRLVAEGKQPSTVHGLLMPLRVICRRAVSRGDLLMNPTTGLELPAARGRRDRIATPDEAVELLSALPDRFRAVWATAAYAGLRLGELLALRWDDVDLDAGVIRVERSWDPEARLVIAPKSRSGVRTVPIAKVLREHLIAHRLSSGRPSGLVFGRTAETPFHPSHLWTTARDAWEAANVKRGKEEIGLLQPIGMHECRHTFASLMIAAGVNAKALSTYMGHTSIGITLDRYGHLMPGNEGEAATLLDAYLDRATGARTGAHHA